MSVAIKREYQDESQTDLERIWIDAREAYFEVACVTKQERQALEKQSIRSIDDILNNKTFRYDKKNAYVRLRHAIAKNADLVIKGASYVASAASVAFPPSSVILTAVTYLLQVCGDISKEYDKIEALLGDVNNFLEQVKMLESRVPKFETYRSHIMRVFTAVLTVCGQATKAVKEGRWGKLGRMMLRGGTDPELASAGSLLEESLKRLMTATSFATLSNTEVIKADLQNLRGQYSEGLEILVELGKDNATDVGEARLEILKVSRKLDDFFAAQRPPISDRKKPEDTQTQGSLSATEAILHLFKNRHDHLTVSHEIELAMIDGTCQWLFDEAAFQDWMGSTPTSKILWLVGAPGYGKSFTSCSISNRLKQVSSGADSKLTATLHIRPLPHVTVKDLDVIGTYFEDLTASVITQVARQSTDFAERTYKRLLEWKDYPNFSSNTSAMWRILLAKYFSLDSKSRLYIIFDGFDQPHLNERLVENSVEEIEKLLDLSDDWARKARSAIRIPFPTLNIKHENIVDDMRRIIDDKVKKLPALKAMPPSTTGLISLMLPDRCQNLLHVDLVMRRLSGMSRIGPILSKIRDLSTGDANVFKLMEEEIVARRTKSQLRTLKVVYGFLTFFHRPLTVDEVNLIAIAVADDPSFDIEEEILIRSNLFLELEVSHGSSDQSELDDGATGKGLLAATSERCWMVRFNHLLIREYFESTASDDFYSLRSFRVTFEGWMFILCAKIVCQLLAHTAVSTHLKTYAASFWPNVLLEVKGESLDRRDLQQIGSLMRSLFNNDNDVVLFLDQSRPKSYSPERQGHKSQWIDLLGAHIDFWPRVQDLLGSFVKRGPSSFDDTTYKWIEESIKNPETIIQPLASAYLQNWLDGRFINRDSAFITLDYMTMSGLLKKEHHLGWSQELGQLLYTTRLSTPDFEALLAVADHLEDRNEYEKAIGASKNHEDRFRAWIKKTYLETYDRSLYEFDITNADELANFFTSDEEKLESYSKRTAEFESLLASVDRDVLQKKDSTCLKRGLITYAGCLRAARKFREAAAIVGELRRRYPDHAFSPRLFSCGLDPHGDGLEIITTIGSWDVIDRLFWLIHDRYHAYDTDYEPHQLLWRSARESKNSNLVEKMYKEVIDLLDSRKSSGTTRVMYARFIYSLHHDYRGARETLSKIVDDHLVADPLTTNPLEEGYMFITIGEVKEMIATILYNEYQCILARDIKSDLVRELEVLAGTFPTGRSDIYTTVETVRIDDVRIAVVLARMFLQGGNFAKFEELTTGIFRYCMEALSDEDGGNNQDALDLLAKILAYIDLPKEAQVAATIRHVNLDRKLRGRKELYQVSDLDEPHDVFGEEESIYLDWPHFEFADEQDWLSESDNHERVQCSACDKWQNWRGSQTTHMYLCLDCCGDFEVCQECYKEMLASSGPPWRHLETLCELTHRYVRVPVDDWKGVKNGRLWIGDQRIKFHDWLDQLRTDKWEHAWMRFWNRSDGVGNIF